MQTISAMQGTSMGMEPIFGAQSYHMVKRYIIIIINTPYDVKRLVQGKGGGDTIFAWRMKIELSFLSEKKRNNLTDQLDVLRGNNERNKSMV